MRGVEDVCVDGRTKAWTAKSIFSTGDRNMRTVSWQTLGMYKMVLEGAERICLGQKGVGSQVVEAVHM